jgi:hypothetical protein
MAPGRIPLFRMARMRRTVQAELLDSLSHDHPDALRCRRDLRLINRIMGNHRWIERTLPPLLRPGETVLEIGAGDGALGLRLAARGIPVDGLDLCPPPRAWPSARAWHSADLRSFGGYTGYPVVLGNLIFHQFDTAELARLGTTLGRSVRVIVACEPFRRRFSQALMAVLGRLLGAAAITLADARTSIAAGFRREELPRALGLHGDEWTIRQDSSGFGAYRMVAVGRGSKASP